MFPYKTGDLVRKITSDAEVVMYSEAPESASADVPHSTKRYLVSSDTVMLVLGRENEDYHFVYNSNRTVFGFIWKTWLTKL